MSIRVAEYCRTALLALFAGAILSAGGVFNGAEAQGVLPIRCDQTERSWATILPNGNHRLVAEFYVTGPCVCGANDPSSGFTSITNRILNNPQGGERPSMLRAAESIFNNGGFTRDGSDITQALRDYVNLEKDFHFKVDPDDDTEKSVQVYCVSISDIAGWASAMRPFAANHQNSFPGN